MTPRSLLTEVLGGERAWLVGGAVRDRLLGRGTGDLDVVIDGDVPAAARALARRARAAAFELSGDWGAWRVSARREGWQVDLNPLRGGSLEADLAQRDFTVNAMAEPLGGGPLVDPLGGARDLRERRLRAAAPEAFERDPLRTLRLVRLAGELALHPDPDTARAAARSAAGLTGVAAERVFAELRRVIAGERPVEGIELAHSLGVLAAVLPELTALDGLEQNRFHHRDVLGHTLEVLAAAIELERDPARHLGPELAGPVAALLCEPLADEMTRGGGLRLGALLHDVAKAATAERLPEGRVIFPGHDRLGAEQALAILGRLRTSERLARHVAALTRHHLRLGFLVREQPLGARAVYRYLRACEPVPADVTLLTVADRLATRGDDAPRAIARHLELARAVLPAALEWTEHGAPAPALRGDELARRLGLERGPRLGELLEELAEARYAGEAQTPEEAVAYARHWLAGRLPAP